MTSLNGSLNTPKTCFFAIAKVDEEQRMVFGYASTEARDQQGEIVRLAAIERALPEYMQFGNIREMHQPSAVGIAKEAEVDHKGLWLGAKVVDDRAWVKCKEGVYKGFSIGGRVTARDPDDRSIITGLELTEISLVDRPANPDAIYEVVKRAKGGVLLPSAVQTWACGIPTHQHPVRLDAEKCMANQSAGFTKLMKEYTEMTTVRTVDEAEKAAADALAELAKAVAEPAVQKTDHVGEAESLHNEATGHQEKSIAHMAKADDAMADAHTAHAAGETDKARGHFTKMADEHDNANMHRDLADQSHEGRLKQLKKAHADGQISDHIAHAEMLHKAATDHASHAQSLKIAADAHDGYADKAVGMNAPDASTCHKGVAESCRKSAGRHEEMAKGMGELHNLHNEVVGKGTGLGLDQEKGSQADPNGKGSGKNETMPDGPGKDTHQPQDEDSDHDGNGMGSGKNPRMPVGSGPEAVAQAKVAVSDAIAQLFNKKVEPLTGEPLLVEALKFKRFEGAGLLMDWLEAVEKIDRYRTRVFPDAEKKELIDKGITLADGTYRITKAKHIALAVQSLPWAKDQDALKAHIIKRAQELFEAATLPKEWEAPITPAEVYLKRELPADKRKDLADKGHAMPDGSYPIENKEDLANAIKVIGCAKNPVAVKSHIKRRAKALDAIDMLPDTWKLVKASTTCAKCGKAVGADDKHCASCGEAVTKEDASKGLGIIAEVAFIIERLESLGMSAEIEQIMEDDDADDTGAQFDAQVASLVNLLRTIVARETAEILEDKDIDVIMASVSDPLLVAASNLQPWAKRVAVVMEKTLSLAKLNDNEKAYLMKSIETLNKYGARNSKTDAGHIQKIHDHTVTLGAQCADATKGVANPEDAVKLAAVTAERDRLLVSLNKVTEQVIPLAREAQATRKKLQGQEKTIEDLTKRLTKVENEPLPSPARGVTGVVRKQDDGSGVSNASSELEQALERAAPGRERAELLVRHALVPSPGNRQR